MKRRLVDPIHVFDAKGRPLSSYEAMEKRIAFLERWIVRLTRMLRRQQMLEDRPPRSASTSIN
jgi:transcription elongation GreA/GreB family factor